MVSGESEEKEVNKSLKMAFCMSGLFDQKDAGCHFQAFAVFRFIMHGIQKESYKSQLNHDASPMISDEKNNIVMT